MAAIGSVLVTCPSCGASLDRAVSIKQVSQNASYLWIDLHRIEIRHDCPGRD